MRDQRARHQMQTACHRQETLLQLALRQAKTASGAFLTPAIASSRRDHGGAFHRRENPLPILPEAETLERPAVPTCMPAQEMIRMVSSRKVAGGRGG